MDIQIAGHATYLYTGGKKLTPADVPTKPVVVFIHGAQQDHSCWLLQSRWFAHHGYAVLALDLPGHGRSGGELLPSVEAMADWIIALLDALHVPQALLVGHSLGSLVALDATARHPSRVRRTALIGTALPMPVSEALLNATRDNEPKAIALVNGWSYSATAQFGGSPAPGMWLLGVNQRLMERQSKGVFFNDMNACNAYQRDLATLADITTPILLIAGSQDRMTSPKAAKALQGLLPSSRLVTLAGSGHALMAERPDGVLDALREFAAGA